MQAGGEAAVRGVGAGMARVVAATALRIVGIVLFVPLAIPFMVVAPSVMIFALARWLFCGPDEDATTRILLGVQWADGLPLWPFELANNLQGKESE